jgi:hypothetical protein
MPAQSEPQRKWAFAVKGPAWARKHHFDTPGPLPPYVKTNSDRLAYAMARKKRHG